jgi:hypothetical protein
LLAVFLLKYYAGTTAVGTVFPAEHESAGTAEIGGLAGAATARTGSVAFGGGFFIFGHGGLSDVFIYLLGYGLRDCKKNIRETAQTTIIP